MSKLTKAQMGTLNSIRREIEDCRDWLMGDGVVLGSPVKAFPLRNAYTCAAAADFGQPEHIATFSKHGTKLNYLNNALRHLDTMLGASE